MLYQIKKEITCSEVKYENKPSLRIAIISTMKGGKSNCHMRASNIKPSCCNQVKTKLDS